MTHFAFNTLNLFYKVIFSFEYLTMQSTPIIYVSHITNLSDARYCAGMGADLLGVVIDPSNADYVSPEAYQQIKGWVSGPKCVVELGHLPTDLELARTNYGADYFHIAVHQLPEIGPSPLPLMVEITFEEFTNRLHTRSLPVDGISFWIVTHVPDTIANAFPSTPPVLIARRSFPGLATDFLSSTCAAGLVLHGSHESVPGLKEYDHLAKVLEELNG